MPHILTHFQSVLANTSTGIPDFLPEAWRLLSLPHFHFQNFLHGTFATHTVLTAIYPCLTHFKQYKVVMSCWWTPHQVQKISWQLFFWFWYNLYRITSLKGLMTLYTWQGMCWYERNVCDIYKVQPARCNFSQFHFVHKMLYMFQAVPLPATCRASCELNKIEKSCILLVVLHKCTYDAQTYEYQMYVTEDNPHCIFWHSRKRWFTL